MKKIEARNSYLGIFLFFCTEEPHNNFPRSNIEYVKVIGKGWFGQVIEAEARDIVPFARKIRVMVKLLREDANGIEQMRFLDESRMYRDANHGNILKLMGHSIEKLPFLLIMEHCPQGDLKSFLISNVIRAELLNSQGTIIKMALGNKNTILGHMLIRDSRAYLHDFFLNFRCC